MNITDSITYKRDITKTIEENDFSFLDGKSVLITGSTGLVCSALVDILIYLCEEKHLNISLYIAGRNKAGAMERFNYSSLLKFILFDAGTPILPDIDVDYIIHAAGNCSPDLYVRQPVETMLPNILGTNYLLDYVKRHGKARLLYISSSEVYGIKEDSNDFIEDSIGFVDFTKIRSSYAMSKRVAETLCRSYALEYKVDVVMARPGHIYGPTCKRNNKVIVSDFAMKAARGEDLVMQSAGLQRRSYMYCLDSAAALLIVLRNGISGESYNIATDDITSIKEMAEMVSSAGGVKLYTSEPTEEEKAAFNPMMNSALNCTKLKAIGFKALFTPNEGLKHTVQSLREIML